MERNEVQGICLAYDSLLRGNLARDGPDQRPAAGRARARSAHQGRADRCSSSAHSADERAALELFFARAAIGRPFVAPPDVPADRVAALRAGLRRDAARSGLPRRRQEAEAQRRADHRRASMTRHHRQRLQDAARDRAAHDAGARPRQLTRIRLDHSPYRAQPSAIAPSPRCASPAMAPISSAPCWR